MWTTRAIEDNFSVVSLDINSVHSSLIPGQFEHILHAERVGIIGNDVINANSYPSLSFTALSASSLLKVPNILIKQKRNKLFVSVNNESQPGKEVRVYLWDNPFFKANFCKKIRGLKQGP